MSTKKVLYVEDDYYNYLLVERILSVFGRIKVHHALTAGQGLELARANLPDLVLVDIHLPGMNGIDFTIRLKADPALAQVPVLALTANVMKGERERALEAGCAEFIAKPFNLESFRQLIAKYLSLHEND